MDTNTGTGSTERKSFTRFFPHIARVLLGLMLLFFGVLGFMHVQPKTPPPQEIQEIFGALMKAGYMPVVSGTMVLVGALLLINRFVPLALALIAPIIAGILTFHLSMQLSTIGPGAVVALLELYLVWSYRGAFCPMLKARVSPGGKCG